jgi:hypothetical protein
MASSIADELAAALAPQTEHAEYLAAVERTLDAYGMRGREDDLIALLQMHIARIEAGAPMPEGFPGDDVARWCELLERQDRASETGKRLDKLDSVLARVEKLRKK